MAFDDGRVLALSKEIFCSGCDAGYLVNVFHDGLFLVQEIERRPPRRVIRAGYSRRGTDIRAP